MLGITNSSTGNQVLNNVFVAVTIDGVAVSANPSGQLLATDATTVEDNSLLGNAWIGGYLGSEDESAAYQPKAEELRLEEFDAAWFADFPLELGHRPQDLAPGADAPWLDRGTLFIGATSDFDGNPRAEPVDLGPFER